MGAVGESRDGAGATLVTQTTVVGMTSTLVWVVCARVAGARCGGGWVGASIGAVVASRACLTERGVYIANVSPAFKATGEKYAHRFGDASWSLYFHAQFLDKNVKWLFSVLLLLLLGGCILDRVHNASPSISVRLKCLHVCYLMPDIYCNAVNVFQWWFSVVIQFLNEYGIKLLALNPARF